MKRIKIAYYSRTGNVKAFVERYLNEYESIDISEVKSINEAYVLITPTYDFGKVPEVVSEWLERNQERMIGVIGSGNTVWGSLYANASEIISAKYNVPLIDKFEVRGEPVDGERIKRKINEMEL